MIYEGAFLPFFVHKTKKNEFSKPKEKEKKTKEK